MKNLNREDRLRLMKFVCALAWADLQVRREETQFVRKLGLRLQLDDDDWQQVEQWLRLPPKPEELDPAEVPKAHRQLLLEAARELIESDRAVSVEEDEIYRLLEELLR